MGGHGPGAAWERPPFFAEKLAFQAPGDRPGNTISIRERVTERTRFLKFFLPHPRVTPPPGGDPGRASLARFIFNKGLQTFSTEALSGKRGCGDFFSSGRVHAFS